MEVHSCWEVRKGDILKGFYVVIHEIRNGETVSVTVPTDKDGNIHPRVIESVKQDYGIELISPITVPIP